MYLIYKVGCDFFLGDGNGGGVFANGNWKKKKKKMITVFGLLI